MPVIDEPFPAYCAECGQERLPTDYACPACGCDLTTDTAAGLGVVRGRHAAFGGPLGIAGLRVGADRIVLLHGPPSGGKTTVALAAMGRPLTGPELDDAGSSGNTIEEPPDRRHGRPAFLSTSEMSPDLVRSYSGRIGYAVERIGVPRFREGTPIPTSADEAGRLFGIPSDLLGADLILDSLTELPEPLRALAAVRAYVRGFQCRAIVIAQDTKDGDVRGSAKVTYQVDVVCDVAHAPHWRVLTVGPKNRCVGGSAAVLFAIDEHGTGRIGPPAWEPDRYYVVDGKGPQYRLIPWPSNEAGNLADPLRAAERRALRLPPPPCAVAAARSRLAGGYQSPPDERARRLFAERAGLVFADPSTFDILED